MALIDDIISKLESLPITNGTLVVSAADFVGIDLMQGFFSNLLRAVSITLTDATRTTGPATITLTGNSDFLGYTQLALGITFDVQDEKVVGTVVATFDKGRKVAVPVLPWISVSDITITTSITQSLSMVAFAFGVNIVTTDGTSIPVVLTFLGGDEWRLDIAEGTSQGIPLTALVELLDGQALLDFLPATLVTVLDAVDLNGMEAIVNGKTKSISYFTTGVTFTKGWDIAPKVSLDPGLQIVLTITNAQDSGSRSLLANVSGTFEVAGVTVPIQVGTSVGGTTIWSFGIQQGKQVTLPSLSALLDLGDAGGDFPTSLQTLPAIEIDVLDIAFDSTQSVLTQLDFSLGTASQWIVIDGYFVVEQLTVALQISNLNVPGSSTTYGTIYGRFLVVDVPLFCSVARTAEKPDWTISAGLPPDTVLDITSLAQKMLEPDIQLPSGVPTIDFGTLLLTSVPGDDTLDFQAASANKWELVKDKLWIESFSISFDYNGKAVSPEPKVKGKIDTTLEIVDVSLELTASLNDTPSGGWQFTGNTKPGDVIHIGDFVMYLTTVFSVPPPPTWVQSITLKDLQTSLNTTTRDFTFGITADALIAGKACELVIAFALTHPVDGYEMELSGTLKVGGQTFTLDVKVGSDTQLGATWKAAQGSSLSLQDIAQIFGDASITSLLGDIPSNMDLALTSLSFTYDFTQKELVLSATSLNYGNLVFVATTIAGTWTFAFLVAIDKIDLGKLPLIGEDLAKLGTFEIDKLNLLLCSGTIDLAHVTSINALITAAATKTGQTLPTLPDTDGGLKAGVNLSMVFKAPGIEKPVSVNTATASKAPPSLMAAGTAAAATTALVLAGDVAGGGGSSVQTQNGYWLNIQKGVGPIYMDKIGFNYTDGKLEVLFNFTMTLGTLKITLTGLMVGSTLSKFDPVFGLEGLSLTFNGGGVEISGGFVRQDVQGVTEYNGQALIKVGNFSLSAMGSYAKVDGQTSLFIFANINYPLGGPPAFFVTGVAAGFGYNRGLTLPNIDEVATFPLVSGFVPGKSSPFSGSDPGAALQVLVSQNVVPVQIGQNWLAAGVQFTSFEMLQSFALLVVEFGTSLEIALLGMTTASIPTGDPTPLLYAQLALEVRILPDDGLISVEAKLTPNSYLLDPNCHLTGGFAFYIWFGSNTHAGDFVVTLGGYNPNFNKPAHYPDVPLLGFNWVVTSELTIKGGMYFALTPTCLMAGGSLSATWQSGGLKAWFDMGADFLISWKPYHYDIHLYLSFGVSYTFRIDLLFVHVTVTISVSLGADLKIWGPPFSGEATIHLWIISFTVSFGANTRPTAASISWEEFEQSFLPAASADDKAVQDARLARRMAEGRMTLARVAGDLSSNTTTYQVPSVKVDTGLARDVPKGVDNPENIDWIVDAQGTSLETGTLIPAKGYVLQFNGIEVLPKAAPGGTVPQVVITNPDALAGITQSFGVGPVGVPNEDFGSVHAVDITYHDGDWKHQQVFEVTAIIADAPKALWQSGKADITSGKTLIPQVLMGFKIAIKTQFPDQTPWADVALLGVQDAAYLPALQWSDPVPVAGPDQPADPFTALESSVLAPAARPGILSALAASGFDIDTEVDLQHMASQASDFLLAPPIFAYQYGK